MEELVLSVFRRRKLRLTEVKLFVQGYTACRDLGSVIVKGKSLTTSRIQYQQFKLGCSLQKELEQLKTKQASLFGVSLGQEHQPPRWYKTTGWKGSCIFSHHFPTLSGLSILTLQRTFGLELLGFSHFSDNFPIVGPRDIPVVTGP